MNKGILGRKLGMSQIFTENGQMIPVTVIEAGPCTVIQKKTVEKEGYVRVLFSLGDTKLSISLIRKVFAERVVKFLFLKRDFNVL